MLLCFMLDYSVYLHALSTLLKNLCKWGNKNAKKNLYRAVRMTIHVRHYMQIFKSWHVNSYSRQWQYQQKYHSQFKIFGCKCDPFSHNLEPCKHMLCLEWCTRGCFISESLKRTGISVVHRRSSFLPLQHTPLWRFKTSFLPADFKWEKKETVKACWQPSLQ